VIWPVAANQDKATTRTLVAVLAHPDDESVASPILARYGREGAQVHLIIATDGAAGGQQTSVAQGPELARVRAEEARRATDALGIRPPIMLGFPDGQLGNYAEEPARLFRLTQRLQEELQRLRPDAMITWGPDGGTGHPDHRLVSAVLTQLARAGAPGQDVFP
jgi:LmbE family N-acetylglucosaminyl deacetylase